MTDRMGIFITAGMTGIDTPVLACRVCGSLVLFDLREEHFDSHARIAELEHANASA